VLIVCVRRAHASQKLLHSPYGRQHMSSMQGLVRARSTLHTANHACKRACNCAEDHPWGQGWLSSRGLCGG
jgi:hypothetical protein